MKEKILYLEQGKKYSDKREEYFMIPNWLFDEGEYIDLDIYERNSLIYMIRLVNKKDNSEGKGDIFFLSAEHLAKICGYSVSKAKKVLKKLQEKGYIKKLKTGSSLIRKANVYQMMNLQPEYVEGVEVNLIDIKEKLNDQEYSELLLKSKGAVYYYPEKGIYSHRKKLCKLVNTFTGEVA